MRESVSCIRVRKCSIVQRWAVNGTALHSYLAVLASPAKYRTVLILRDVQQMSIAETAKALGISKENVKTRTSRARLQMRDRLAPGWRGAWGEAHSE